MAGNPPVSKYPEAPIPTSGMPPGMPFIIGNEAAERFSFYGMRAVLVVFMTQYLLNAGGGLAVMDEAEAKGWYHVFVSAVYFTPVFGALLADGLLGKYRTIVGLSLVYCLGHAALALDHTRVGLAVGLGLIAVGSGGIKPCVSAHLGDQFGQRNRHLISTAFGWFYLAVNLGAFVSTLATPWLLEHRGAGWAFAVPGVLMAVATVTFWFGRYRFAHIPAGGRRFVRAALSGEGLRAMGRLAVLFLFVTVFWSLFDQTGSAWVLQAGHMDREVFGVTVLPAQMQAANPLLVLVLVPLFAYRVYPAVARRVRLTPLRKIGAGMFTAAAAFAIPTGVQFAIDAGAAPHIGWQLAAYVVMTCAEVMVSITGLEFAYTQAPRALKSLVMAFFMLSISAGNLFTGAVNFLIRNPDGTTRLAGADYYVFFTALMLVTACAFVAVSRRYRGRTYIQEDHPPESALGHE